MSEGECKVFRAAAVETCGLTQADQGVIDENAEAAACRWKRPEPRTPACADLRAEIVALRAPKPVDASGNPPAQKKRTIMGLLRGVK